jgi:hypothetical protein
VETLPTKEEIIVWVELTKEQKKYYRAIYENRIDASPLPLTPTRLLLSSEMCPHPHCEHPPRRMRFFGRIG